MADDPRAAALKLSPQARARQDRRDGDKVMATPRDLLLADAPSAAEA